ncbi:MAG: MMPL family transporter [Proteobacteria bacterium]|nr:MMPL family transporter [Pseudomonadota bacterium]
MNHYIRLILTWPKSSLLAIILLTAFFFMGMPHLRFDNTIDAFMPKKDREYLYYNKVKKMYGNNDLIYILSVTHDHLWTSETFDLLNNFIVDLEEYIKFDEEKENHRLTRLNTLLKKEKVSSNEILNVFSDDPVFQRLLNRKCRAIHQNNHILTNKNIEKLYSEILKTSTLKRNQTIDRIISLFTISDITGENNELATFDIIDRNQNGTRILPKTDRDFEIIKERLRRNPSFKDGLYALNDKTGEITDFGIFIKFSEQDDNDPITRELYEIINSYNSLKIASFGQPYVNMIYNDYMRKDLSTFLPIVLIVVVSVFFYNFRSMRGVFIPCLVLCAADIWVLGLMGYLGHRMTSVGVSLPTLMIAIGSSYSIHILNQYYFDFDLISKNEKKEGLYMSMTHISTTVLLAGLTTIIAFMTLTSSNLTAIKEWAFFSAFGVFSAMIISLTVIPAGLMLLPHKKPSLKSSLPGKPSKTFSDLLIQIFTTVSKLHSKKVILVSGIIVIIAFFGLLKLNVETQFLLNFKENDPVRINYNIISEKVGGEIGVNVIFDTGKAYGALEPEFLLFIETFRSWLTAPENEYLHIGRTDAFGDFLKIMHKAMNNNDEAFYKIPDDRMEIKDYLELYSGDDTNNDGRADDFEPFIDENFQACSVAARFSKKDGEVMGTNTMKKTVASIKAYLINNLPVDKCTYAITGNNIMIIKFCDFIVDGQIKSLISSLGVIAIIVFLLFNNLNAGLLALIPMSTAVIISFGIMGWFGIDLDITTSIIAAITIGIGVDDTIHFLNTYRYYLSQGLTVNQTIEKTLSVSGKAIIFTSFALILGFGVLVTSSFKPLILFGLLMSITMITTTLGALLILPSVIKVTQVRLENTFENKGLKKYINFSRIFGLE